MIKIYSAILLLMLPFLSAVTFQGNRQEQNRNLLIGLEDVRPQLGRFSAGVERARVVKLNENLLRQYTEEGYRLSEDKRPQFSFNLFEDRGKNITYDGIIEHISKEPQQLTVLRGKLQLPQSSRQRVEPAGTFTLTSQNNLIAAHIITPEGTFNIVPIKGGNYVVEQLKPTEPFKCGVNDRKLNRNERRTAQTYTKRELRRMSSTPRQPSNVTTLNMTDITVLVVYTKQAKDDFGSKELIEARIRLAEALTNDTFNNSLIPLRIRVVRMEETSFQESGSFDSDLDDLALRASGQQVREWRDQAQADLVGYIASSGDYAGLAFGLYPRWELNPPPSPLDPSQFEYWRARAFFAVRDDHVARWYYAFTHELAHDLGAGHETGYLRLYPDSHGWYFNPPNDTPNEGEVGTMMSYRGAGVPPNTRRKLYFSNPEVMYAGAPTGKVGHNNARAIRDAMGMVSRYR